MEEVKNPTGTIFNIQSFCLQDGPGIRTTVFFKGCNLRCWWCHNPESWSRRPELLFYPSKCIGCQSCLPVCPERENEKTARFTSRCTSCFACSQVCYSEAIQRTGAQMQAEELFKRLIKDRDLFEQSGGGVTFSGGEPLMQPEFLRAVLSLCKENGLHTAMETAASVSWETLASVLPLLDLVFCDIKTMDAKSHEEATGVSNRLILENIKKLSRSGTALILRMPIIPGFNNTPSDLQAVGAFAASLPGKPQVELLPFHSVCGGKYEALGLSYRGNGLPTPTKDDLAALYNLLKEAGANTKE